MAWLVLPLLLLSTALVPKQCQAAWTWIVPFKNLTDAQGVHYIDGWYWIHVNQVLPAIRHVWLNGVISEKLAAQYGFNTIVPDEGFDPLRILRTVVRYRVIRWIVACVALKVLAVLFILVVLPNLYFLAMMRTDEMEMK